MTCTRNFVCEVDLYVKSVNKALHARKYAHSQCMATKLCALSIVRQLYHLGEIDADGDNVALKRRRFADKIQRFEISVDKDIIKDIDVYLKDYGIEYVKVPKSIKNEEPLSLVLENNTEEKARNKPHTAGGVSWLPPQPRWNPWTRSVIDEGSFADLTLPDISELLKLEYDYRVENDADVKKMLDNQKKFPVYQFKEDILYASYQNRVIIINGLPDCGKTTQVPQYILNAYLQANCGAKCSIVVTQPLCLHAVSAAEIVAKERVESPGNTVGYDVKFESCLPRPYGSILYCNAGVFLRKLENGMHGISHVIVDNIQEKEIFTDFTMAVLRDMIQANPQLRVILMCCSSDVTLYFEYFGRCPVIEITGPSFPVEEYFLEDCIELMNYVPPLKPVPQVFDDDMQLVENEQDMNKVIDAKYSEATREAMARIDEREVDYDLVTALLKYIFGLGDHGTVLIVAPNWNVIIGFIKHLKELPDFNHSDYNILILHEYITREELYKILEPVQVNIRKIIIATQVAETSVLVNDAVYVIDCNKIRRVVGSVNNRLIYYHTCWTTKEHMQLRKSRACNVRPGYVFNICSRARFEKLAKYRGTEMCVSLLYEISLLVKLLHLGDISEFLSKSIEPPKEQTVKLTEDVLKDIGVFDCFNELTSLGKLVARLPLEPSLGKMIIMSCIFKIAEPVCFIAAYESGYDFSKTKQWQSEISKFKSEKPSDQLSTLNILMNWEEKFKEGEKEAEQFCEEYSLVHEAFLNAYNARNYLKDLLISAGFPESCFVPHTFRFTGDDKRLDWVLACFCAGYYPNVCIFVRNHTFMSNDGRPLLPFSTSVMRLQAAPKTLLFPSPYVVYSSKIQFKSVYIREISYITPLTLLLFGCKRAEYKNGKIFVDKWTRFESSPQDIAKILALLSPIQDLVDQVADNPKMLTHLKSRFAQLVGLIKNLCRTNAYSFNWLLGNSWVNFPAEKAEETGDPPAKMRKLNEKDDSGDTTSGNFIVDTKNKFCFIEFEPLRKGFQGLKTIGIGDYHPSAKAESQNIANPSGFRSHEGNINDQIGKQSENFKHQENFKEIKYPEVDRNHLYNPSLFSGPNAKQSDKLENQKNELSIKNAIHHMNQEDKVSTLDAMQKSFSHQNINFNKRKKGFKPKIHNALTLEENELKALTLFSKYLSEREVEERKNKNKGFENSELRRQIENFNKTAMEVGKNDDAISKGSVGHTSAFGSSDNCRSVNLKNQEDEGKVEEFSSQVESTSRQPVRFTIAKSSTSLQPINISKQFRDCNEMSESNVDLPSTISCSEEPIFSNQERDETRIGIFNTLIEGLNENEGELAKFYKDINKAFVDLPSALNSSDKNVSPNLNNQVEDFSTSIAGEIGLSLQNTRLDRNFENQITMPSSMAGNNDKEEGFCDKNFSNKKIKFDNTSDRFDSHKEEERSGNLDKGCTRLKRAFTSESGVYGGQVSGQDFGVKGDQYKIPVIVNSVHKGFSGQKDSYKSLEKDFSHQSKGYHNKKEVSFEDQVSTFVNKVRGVTEIEGQLKTNWYKSERTDMQSGSHVDRDDSTRRRLGVQSNAGKKVKINQDSRYNSLSKKESFSNQSSRENMVRLGRKDSNFSDLEGGNISQRRRYENEEDNYYPQKVYWNQGTTSDSSQLNDVRSAESCSNSEYGNNQKGNYCPSTRQLGNTRSKEYFGFNKVSSHSKQYQRPSK